MAHFMTEDGLYFFLVHRAQQAGTYCNQRLVFVHAGGKSVGRGGIEDGDFRYSDMGGHRQFFDCIHQPDFSSTLGIRDDFRAHQSFGHPFGHGQRYERTPEAEYSGENKQVVHIQTGTAFIQKTIYSEQTQDDAQNKNYGNIGSEKQ